MGYQAETAVILEFIWLVQTCFHRHFLTRLPLFEANFFSIQPLAFRAERSPALAGAKGWSLYTATQRLTNLTTNCRKSMSHL
ncbi:hypothetical protein OU5_3049 [Pseudomonas mandelii JR-1]|uniref:Uncharacterized protein n=1 Tax=Pseudomonas mandelii JR-1 TaxID=1147786 RepID=A0A024ECQ6_9PSED|nr:hypothetical protein OU5_3049 [Pseudomonas mandelii JR-1]